MQERVKLLQRAILVFSEGTAGETAEQADTRTACLLDLGLRLLHLLNMSREDRTDWLVQLSAAASVPDTKVPTIEGKSSPLLLP